MRMNTGDHTEASWKAKDIMLPLSSLYHKYSINFSYMHKGPCIYGPFLYILYLSKISFLAFKMKYIFLYTLQILCIDPSGIC